jgi:hypothetical protein
LELFYFKSWRLVAVAAGKVCSLSLREGVRVRDYGLS